MTKYEKKVVQVGAGKIGRGYLAELFQAAEYKIIFLDYAESLVKALNAQGYYTIFKRNFDGGPPSKTIVKNFEAYCTQTEWDECVDALAHTNYASINVYPGATQSIGHMIGAAIKKRIAEGDFSTLDCIIGVNFLHSSRILHDYVKEVLTTDQEFAYLEEKVGFIEGLVERNGAEPTPEMYAEDALACNSSDADSMTIDKDAFKGPAPAGVNFILKENVPAWMVHKIWIGNMSHCLRGVFGRKAGYTYMGEADDDPYIAKCGVLAMVEAEFAIHKAYGLSYEEMRADSSYGSEQANYLNHAANAANKDTITRVCADMIRKLSKEDRFIGPALAAMANGKIPYFIARGAAMGFYYDNMEDPTVAQIQGYLKENGIAKAIEKYCGLSDDVEAENKLKQLIIAEYYDIGTQNPNEISYIK